MRDPAEIFGDYLPLDAGVTGALRDAPREVAEAHLARLLAARPARLAALAALAARAGVALEPGPFGAWLVDAMRTPDPRWNGVVVDLALWLGERMIAIAPQLRWELHVTHKKATGYQRPVLVGFTRVPDPHYYVDVAHLIARWADLATRGRAARGDFLETIERVTLADA
jgi:hypothetical protein